MNQSVTSRVSIAAASALMALASLTISTHVNAAEAAAAKEPVGRCYGINTCKGTSLCATAKNDCKGLNSSARARACWFAPRPRAWPKAAP
jgi:uncharacterized membrane protein